MRYLLILSLILAFSLNLFSQEDTSDYEYEIPVLDTFRVHRFGFVIGGGVQQLKLIESIGIVDDSLNNWNSAVRPMYKVGVIYNRRINERVSFQSGLIVSNSFYRLSFTDKQSLRSDTNGYSQIDIPFDFRLSIYKGYQFTGGIQYHTDITKSLLKEMRLFDLKRNSLSVKAGIGHRFVLGGKYLQLDGFFQYSMTNILNRNNRYSEGLESIRPYQIGLRLVFY